MSRDDLAARRGMDTVYQPAEDSRLLAETAVARCDPTDRVVEVGTGSGYVAARVAEEVGARVVGCDISPLAVREARERGVETVRSDLLGPFADGCADVVLFNPPYLPTDPDEEWDDWMEHALSGGADGRRVIDPFLDDVGRVLAPDGRAYLLLSTLTDPAAVADRAAEDGLACRTVAEEAHPFERLLVFEITHKH